MSIFVGLTAVSYTHLDVYKRQPKECVCKGTSPLNPLSAGCHRLLSIVTKMLTYGSNKYSCTSSAVSYTHLDVYKRQQAVKPGSEIHNFREKELDYVRPELSHFE